MGSSSSASSSTGGPTASDLAIDIVAPGPAPLHFKIDATEVTVAKYAAFIAAFEAETPANQKLNQHAVCGWNGSVRPNVATPDAAGPTVPAMECLSYDLATEVVARPNGPIRCIDWCDAAAYCIWAGGYMCRSNEGDPTHPVEWKTACASPSGNKFPYGQNYLANHCVDAGILPKPTNVATYPLCQSSYAGVYDMSGNVSEWLDCGCEFEGTDPTTTNAYLGGGAYHNTGDDLDCTPNNTSAIGGFRKDVGARCCYDP
jgi:formylglycine-generating enzyme required for sulfatase activity